MEGRCSQYNICFGIRLRGFSCKTTESEEIIEMWSGEKCVPSEAGETAASILVVLAVLYQTERTVIVVIMSSTSDEDDDGDSVVFFGDDRFEDAPDRAPGVPESCPPDVSPSVTDAEIFPFEVLGNVYPGRRDADLEFFRRDVELDGTSATSSPSDRMGFDQMGSDRAGSEFVQPMIETGGDLAEQTVVLARSSFRNDAQRTGVEDKDPSSVQGCAAPRNSVPLTPSPFGGAVGLGASASGEGAVGLGVPPSGDGASEELLPRSEELRGPISTVLTTGVTTSVPTFSADHDADPLPSSSTRGTDSRSPTDCVVPPNPRPLLEELVKRVVVQKSQLRGENENLKQQVRSLENKLALVEEAHGRRLKRQAEEYEYQMAALRQRCGKQEGELGKGVLCRRGFLGVFIVCCECMFGRFDVFDMTLFLYPQ